MSIPMLSQRGEGESSMMSERDLIRQVASNMTKDLISSHGGALNEDQARKGKQIMVQNLTTCSKVWQAFEKFIYKQVCVKNKIADTCIVGIFRKSGDSL